MAEMTNKQADSGAAGVSGAPADYKVREVRSGSAFRAYRLLMYGEMGLWKVLWAEFLFWAFGGMGGALGLGLRGLTYPVLFKRCGRKVVFGKNVTIRHPHKIELGDGVVLDEGAMVDAKGSDNAGIVLGERVYVGRNTLIYCKNGDIAIGDDISISANCVLFSSNRLTLKPGTVIASFVYVLSGGEYDLEDPTAFAFQQGTRTRGALEIGESCWLGAGVKVLDGACIGDRCVVGAGAVVNQPLPADSIAVGVPARVIKSRVAGE